MQIQTPPELAFLIDLTESAALLELEARQYFIRIERRDNEIFPCTCETHRDRVNLAIDKGKVTLAYFG